MKIGIMQPYFLPYIAYFSLISLVDKFVYYDDVQYIKRGWINRNRVKMKNEWLYVTLPIKKASLNSNINEVFVVSNKREIEKIKKTIKHCYINAPNYEKIKNIVFENIKPGLNISKLNINLINTICNYLNIETKMYISSEIEKKSTLKGENQILEICKKLNGNHYINPIGGKELYQKKKIDEYAIKLNFIEMDKIEYYQGKYDFIENLSFLDVLMWCSKDKIHNLLKMYKLV